MIIKFIGQCSINLFQSIKYIVTGKINFKETLLQSATIGADSAAISLVITLVSGCVLALQVSKQFILSGADAYIGGLISIAMIREMAPIFASLAIGARAGTAIAAELGNMKVTEQIDAMKTLRVDPIKYLLVPRIIAGAFMVPVVTFLSIIIGIFGGMLISQQTVNLHINRYSHSVWLYTDIYDIHVSLFKATVFGILIALICSTHGLETNGGAKEVGASTTKAAIWCTCAILIFDFIITWTFYS